MHQLLESFNDIQVKIELLEPENIQNEAKRKSFENSYFQAVALARNMIIVKETENIESVMACTGSFSNE